MYFKLNVSTQKAFICNEMLLYAVLLAVSIAGLTSTDQLSGELHHLQDVFEYNGYPTGTVINSLLETTHQREHISTTIASENTQVLITPYTHGLSERIELQVRN